jgi:carboxyl-terminal processing protease
MRVGRLITIIAILAVTVLAWAQKLDERDRTEARDMLRMIADDVRKHYYDPNLHGPEFNDRVRAADEKIKAATSLSQAFAMIGFALEGLHDSHTYFLPPGRTQLMRYGWRPQFIGDRCYVTRVRPGSDADAQGLRAGDQILAINGLPLIREDFAKVEYILTILAPQPELKLRVRGADGKERQLQVAAKIREVPKLIDLSDPGVYYRKILREILGADRDPVVGTYIERGEPLAIFKLREFDLDDDHVDKIISIARKHQGLILDLRDNPGGEVSVLDKLLGRFFDHEVKIADRVSRKPMKPQVTKPEKDPFLRELVVLVDSSSASAAEIFARVIQLEKRGIVLGDRTAGLVMEGRLYPYRVGVDSHVYFGAMITEANLVMSDGSSLEGKGVTPDEVLVPTPDNLRREEDPVLARAAQLLGVEITPAEAGKLFPYEWPH